LYLESRSFNHILLGQAATERNLFLLDGGKLNDNHRVCELKEKEIMYNDDFLYIGSLRRKHFVLIAASLIACCYFVMVWYLRTHVAVFLELMSLKL
jgi:hypothetical protein